MSAHTPGPWIYGTVTGKPGFQFFVDGDSSLVADIAARPEAEANARLIAAAPELAKRELDAVCRYLAAEAAALEEDADRTRREGRGIQLYVDQAAALRHAVKNLRAGKHHDRAEGDLG